MTPLCTAQRSWPLDPALVDLDGVWTTLTGPLLDGGREDRLELLFHSVAGESRVALATGAGGQILHLEASRYEAVAAAYSTAREECQRLLARVESCLPAADASGAEVSMDFWNQVPCRIHRDSAHSQRGLESALVAFGVLPDERGGASRLDLGETGEQPGPVEPPARVTGAVLASFMGARVP